MIVEAWMFLLAWLVLVVGTDLLIYGLHRLFRQSWRQVLGVLVLLPLWILAAPLALVFVLLWPFRWALRQVFKYER